MMVRVLKQARFLQYFLQFCADVIDAELYVHSVGRLALLCRKEQCCLQLQNNSGQCWGGQLVMGAKYTLQRESAVCSLCCLSAVWGQIHCSFAHVFPGFNIKVMWKLYDIYVDFVWLSLLLIHSVSNQLLVSLSKKSILIYGKRNFCSNCFFCRL